MSGLAELITSVSVLVSALGAIYARKARDQAREVNDAVNHTHKTGTPRIYDMVREVRDEVRGLGDRVAKLEGQSQDQLGSQDGEELID